MEKDKVDSSVILHTKINSGWLVYIPKLVEECVGNPFYGIEVEQNFINETLKKSTCHKGEIAQYANQNLVLLLNK